MGLDLHGKQWAFWIDPLQNIDDHGYVPSVVIADEPGHYPQVKDEQTHQRPWYWGNTLEKAREICREANLEHGVGPDEALRIVMSSMAAGTEGVGFTE